MVILLKVFKSSRFDKRWIKENERQIFLYDVGKTNVLG